MRVLAYAAMGGLAGQGGAEQMVAQSGGHRSGGVGVGFQYGLAAGQNLQNLALRRQQMREMSDYRQAQTNRINAQTAAIPGQQADLSKLRQARTGYIGAQTEKLKAEADKLKRAPNDKLLHSYNAADGKVHFLYQKSNGDTYEKASDQDFSQQPKTPPRPLKATGPDGSVYLIDPQTGHSRMVIQGKGKPRLGSPDQFRRVEQYKEREWKKIQNNSFLSEEEKLNHLEDLERHYGRLVETLGGTYVPYDVRSGIKAAPEATAPTGQGFWSQVPGAVRRH